MSGVNKTLYIAEGDAETWRQAQRHLRFYQDKGLSEFLTEKLREYLHEEQQRLAVTAAGRD